MHVSLGELVSRQRNCDLKPGDNYHKIPKIIPGAYILKGPFLRGLFLEGLIYGGKFVFQNGLG